MQRIVSSFVWLFTTLVQIAQTSQAHLTHCAHGFDGDHAAEELQIGNGGLRVPEHRSGVSRESPVRSYTNEH
jgi:hypothetical protein